MTRVLGKITADTCHDPVVIVPGTMGSELRDAATGTVLWGMSSLEWYVRAWTSGQGLSDLCLTAEEREGHYGRVEPTRLLAFPAFARVFAGFEPYTALIKRVRRCVVHEDAVLDFPYDWRLPVARNAEWLAEAAEAHLTAWRRSVRDEPERAHPDGREPRLVFVAHSMGGLLVRYLSTIPGFSEKIRTTITLGTPFFGSVKAAVLLNSGRGAPIPMPARRPIRAVLNPVADEGLRRLACNLPGVHDLLPTYRCLDENATDAAKPARRLTVHDVCDLGGDRDLAEGWQSLHDRLEKVQPVGHRAVVGVAQPTLQSMTVSQGLVTGHRYACTGDPNKPTRIDRMGDGTVYRDSATTGVAGKHVYLPVQHTGLAQVDEVLTNVCAILTEAEASFGPPMAAGELGVEPPDVVDPNQEWTALVTGIDHPRHARCTIVDEDKGRQVAAPELEWRDNELVVAARLPYPGVFRLRIAGAGFSPVSQLVLARDPNLSTE